MADTPTTAQTIINSAFGAFGSFAPGETVDSTNSTAALARLNLMMSSLRLQPLSQPVIAREEFDLEADKGGPSDPYTIGPGGDFDTTKPVRLDGAAILLVQPSPSQNIEVPRAVLTDDAWQAIQIKELSSSLFTNVYFNPTWSTQGLGTINLWPVPNTSTNKLVIYRPEFLSSFTNLSTQYYLPPGLEEALVYQLALRLLTPYGVVDPQVRADIGQLASWTLRNYKRGNVDLSDRPTDPALTRDPAGGYNILTGTGGGAGS